MLSNEMTLELIEKAQHGDKEAKEILVTENSPLIKSVIRKYIGKNIEYDDLYQLGSIGFLKAINNFRTSFNVKFSTYAVPMVVGEIKRFMRDDGEIKVSRAIKSQNLQITKFVENFLKEHNRKPSIEEISHEFGIDECEVIFTMESSKMPISMYTPLEDDGGKSLLLIDRYTESQTSGDALDSLALKEALAGLDERDKKIVLLRFFRDKTQSEIAKVLNISQVQVSRLESKILEKMKKRLEVN